MPNGLHYVACWTEKDGLYSCGHEHESVAAAMGCVIPDGRTFIRAVQGGVTRSLDDHELAEFRAASLRFRGNEEKEYRRPAAAPGVDDFTRRARRLPAPQHSVSCRNLQFKPEWGLN
jgi:hypothetical protein